MLNHIAVFSVSHGRNWKRSSHLCGLARPASLDHDRGQDSRIPRPSRIHQDKATTNLAMLANVVQLMNRYFTQLQLPTNLVPKWNSAIGSCCFTVKSGFHACVTERLKNRLFQSYKPPSHCVAPVCCNRLNYKIKVTRRDRPSRNIRIKHFPGGFAERQPQAVMTV